MNWMLQSCIFDFLVKGNVKKSSLCLGQECKWKLVILICQQWCILQLSVKHNIPLKLPFLFGYFSFVLVIFYVLGLMPTMQRELNEKTLQKSSSSCLFTFLCSTLEILKRIWPWKKVFFKAFDSLWHIMCVCIMQVPSCPLLYSWRSKVITQNFMSVTSTVGGLSVLPKPRCAFFFPMNFIGNNKRLFL